MMQSKRIAVTGGIGSGKSTVLALLKERGFPVFSCDEIYAKLCTETSYLTSLSALFPDCFQDNVLDRSLLSKKVFSDREALEKLNALSHPLVMRRLLCEMQPFPLSFAEVPLLFEGGYASAFDGVIAVLREKHARVRSVMERSGLSEEDVLARMAQQYDYSVLPAGCYPLKNDGTLTELRIALAKILSQIKNVP